MFQIRSLFKKTMIWFMWYPFRILIRILPIQITYLLGITGGKLLYWTSKDKRKIIVEEMNCIFPSKHFGEIEDIIKQSFINYVLSELEVLFYPTMNIELINKMIVIEGKKHLDDAFSKGSGVLLFQAHFGAFQVVMPAIGYSGYKMNQVSASASIWKEEVDLKIQKKSIDIKANYEKILPVKHISVDSSLRPVFRALERNEIVGITVDGGGGKKVLPLTFLGRTANFQKGAADIALRTGAMIVPAFILTEKRFKHKLIIHPPLKTNRTGEKDDDIQRILTEFVKILEYYVYQYPCHYGYSLYLRKSRALQDPYPFFEDHLTTSKKDHIA